MSVPSIKLTSGKTIPGLGLGFWETPLGVAPKLSYEGLKLGYRLIDTAQVYGNEKEVVEGIAKWLKESPSNKREDVFYTTKIFDVDHGYEKTTAAIKKALDTAKDIDYIDLILVHSPQSNSEKRHGTWTALQEAVAAGKVKSIGVSNYGIKHLKEILAYPDLKIKPVVDQLELTPWCTKPELIKFLHENDILPEAYSPLTRGNKLDDPDLVKLAKKYNKSPAQVLLRWSIQEGFLPLAKTTHVDRAAENFDVFDFKLSTAEVKLLEGKNDNTFYCWFGKDPTEYPLDNE